MIFSRRGTVTGLTELPCRRAPVLPGAAASVPQAPHTRARTLAKPPRVDGHDEVAARHTHTLSGTGRGEGVWGRGARGGCAAGRTQDARARGGANRLTARRPGQLRPAPGRGPRRAQREEGETKPGGCGATWSARASAAGGAEGRTMAQAVQAPTVAGADRRTDPVCHTIIGRQRIRIRRAQGPS